jgi:hypothetical protein
LTYKELGDKGQAVEHLTTLLTQFPKAPVRKDSQALLSQLGGKQVNGVVPAGLAAASAGKTKSTLPPPLPPTFSSLAQSPASPAVGRSGDGPPIITCGLNTSC